MPTLRQALDETYERRWRHKRSAACLRSQASKAASELAWSLQRKTPRSGPDYLALWTVAEASAPSLLPEAVARWYTEGASPATINKRLNCLSAMGVNVAGARKKGPKVLQWWLTPQDQEKVTTMLRGCKVLFGWNEQNMAEVADRHLLADFIDWTCATGLRVEESLALRWRAFLTVDGNLSVLVPGTKTASSQATLPLSAEAYELVRRRDNAIYGNSGRKPGDDDHVFPITYKRLHALWDECRAYLGVSDVPTSTLKALRRSFAWRATMRGMPTAVLQQYLRHDDIKTTLGYLRLTGGLLGEETRKWL